GINVASRLKVIDRPTQVHDQLDLLFPVPEVELDRLAGTAGEGGVDHHHGSTRAGKRLARGHQFVPRPGKLTSIWRPPLGRGRAVRLAACAVAIAGTI